MSHVFSNAHHMSKSLMGVRREIRIILPVVNKFPEMELQEGADINSGPSGILKGNSVNGSAESMV